MRYVEVEPGSIVEQPGGAIATGTDENTGELVKFVISLSAAASVQRHRYASVIDVGDGDIISVEPTSGEWDSPGTSPEEGDDDGHRAW